MEPASVTSSPSRIQVIAERGDDQHVEAPPRQPLQPRRDEGDDLAGFAHLASGLKRPSRQTRPAREWFALLRRRSSPFCRARASPITRLNSS